MQRTAAALLTILALAWGSLPAAPAAGAPAAIVRVTGGRLTVEAHGVPLAQVLGAVARQSGIRIALHGAREERLTAALRDLPLDRGLQRLLRTLDAVYIYGPAPGPGGPRLIEVRIYGTGPAPPGAPPARQAARARPGLDGPRRVEPLARLLEDGDRGERRRAAEALGRTWSEEAVDPLGRALGADEDAAVRARAARALGQTWSERALPALAEALGTDRDPAVREAAAAALGESWHQGALAPLGQALIADRQRGVRERAARALGEVAEPEATWLLLQALRDRDAGVRESAAAALGRTGDAEAVAALHHAAESDRDAWVRGAARDALARIAPR